MLRGLSIKDMLIIDRLELDFQPGLNVLTGETGAGKSILLDSLGFVLGWRGRADLVRKGAKQGEVIAVFDLNENHPARKVLQDAGLPEETELILRRINSPDGRKISFVNDRRCSSAMLRRLSDCLVELHGQHNDRGLLNPSEHLGLLDTFARIDLSDLRAIWQKYKAVQKELEEAQNTHKKAQEDADFLHHSVQEFDLLSPLYGEDEKLDKKRRFMQASERIREDIVKANDVMASSAAEGLLNDASRWLEGAAVSSEGRLDGAITSLSRALSELADAQLGVEKCLKSLSFNPLDLEKIEERLFEIRAMARKHSVQPDELEKLGVDLKARLSAIDTGANNIILLQEKLSTSLNEYDKVAKEIRKKRHKAGKKLSKLMGQELAPLKMEHAEFIVSLDEAAANKNGIDAVLFKVRTNPGAPVGAINKIASGGELSRFLLALKVCLTKNTTGLTLIFDEIDRGVGGATADAVGRRLADISQGSQVLVVTHSPQVAAKGAFQWLVSKSVSQNETFSTVVRIDGEARVDEIARMLAGNKVTNEARAAARSLLES